MLRPAPFAFVFALATAAGTGCASPNGGGSGIDFNQPKDTSGIGGLEDGTGEDGGAAPEPGGDVAGPGLPDVEAPPGSVMALQVAAEGLGCDPEGLKTFDENASVKGAVVTSPEYQASKTSGLQGYYLADPGGGPWAGIGLVAAKELALDLAPGDVVDVEGTLEEAWCNTQLKATKVTKTGSTAPPAATPVLAAESAAEAWEGVLISLSAVEVTSDEGGGRYGLDGGLVADHDFDLFLELEVGETYDLTGLVKYSFDRFRLMPRSEDDVALVGAPGPEPSGDGGPVGDGGEPEGPAASPISEVQEDAESVSCTKDGIQNFDVVTIEGVVVVPRWEAHASLWGYAIRDDVGPWNGVLVTIPKSGGLDQDFPAGARLRVTGEHTEYYCQTQVKAQAIEIVDGTSGPEPDLAPTEVEDLSTALESWEGVFVRTTATVTGLGTWEEYGEAETSGGFLLDGHLFEIDEPEIGETYEVVGLVRYAFGSYRVSAVGPLEIPSPDPEPDPAPVPLPDEDPEPAADAAEPEPDVAAPDASEPDASEPEPAPDASEPEPAPDASEPESAPDAAAPDPAPDASEPEPAPDASEPEPAPDASEPEPAPDAAAPEPSVEPIAIADIQGGEASLGCDPDTQAFVASDLLVEGIVQVGPWSLSGGLTGYVLTDGTSLPFSGVHLAVPKNADPAWPLGSKVRVVADQKEYFCWTELHVESSELLGDAPVPAPIFVDDFTASPEAWEGSLVTVTSALVVDDGEYDDFGTLTTDEGFLLDDSIVGKKAYPKLEPGTLLLSVTGVVRFAFGTYRIEPRTLADLVVAD